MSKFVLKDNPKEEVRIGDSITATRKTDYGQLTITRTIDEDVLQELVEHGVVIKVDDTPKEQALDIMDLIEHLAKRVNWKTENLKKYMENLFTINPVAVYQTLLKEGAIILDSKYDGHISEIGKVYAVSILDGEVFEVEQVGCGNYTNIALFRTPSDAVIAKRALAIIETEIFNG